VILLVKSVIFPTTLFEKVEIPVAMELAKSPPGIFGRATPPGLPGLGVRALGPAVRVGLKVGSYLFHHIGT